MNTHHLRNNFLLAIFCIMICINADAQKNGITFSPFNFASYAKLSLTSQGYMGMGYERNVGDYITLKVEVNKGFQLTYKLGAGELGDFTGQNYSNVSVYDSSTGYSDSYPYHWTAPFFEINYQSKFFFRGNDRTGAYMAMGIGFRTVTEELHLGTASDDYISDDLPADLKHLDGYKEKFTIIPLLLRFGIRGNLEGFYPDLSMGIGYNIAHDKKVTDGTITNKYHMSVPTLTGFSMTGSIAFGIGW